MAQVDSARTLLLLAFTLFMICLPVERCPANEALRQFLSEHCFGCHQGDEAEAALDLETLTTDFEFSSDLNDDGRFDHWVKIFDRVAAGEMPPADAEAVPTEEQERFLAQAKTWLNTTQAAYQNAHGRVQGRRLTNLQLERTLQDLLGIDIPLALEMPEEPKTGQYKSLAALQSISHFHLEQHLKIVDMALDEAFRRALSPSDQWRKEMSAEQISRTRPRTREPEFIDGAAVIWSGNLIFYGRMPATMATESGWYRFRFEAASLKQPKDHGVWCSVNSGLCVSSAPLMTWIDSFEATDESKEVVVEAWLPKGHMLEIRPADLTLKRARFAGGQSANGEGGDQNVPGVRITGLTMERIHRGANDETLRQNLFGNLDVSTSENGRQGRMLVDIPERDGHRLIVEFASRAFRRPIPQELLETYLAIFDDAFASTIAMDSQGDDSENPKRKGRDRKSESASPSAAFINGLRAAYRAVLCSPRFLYFQEQAGELDDYAVASRLSYLIWNSLPDEKLMELAAKGTLREPEVLRSELQRMLTSERGLRFHEDFAREWLELSEIDFTEPDSRLHPQFDRVVQYSMLDETHAFLQTMLAENRNVQELLTADFTFANSRLARYYGLPNVTGDTLQRIELKASDNRGGLLGQGAILKVTANGTNTSPVLRGVWVSRRILGEPIAPPPDNVPAIEPDIRGAKTIREQLEKHREQAECASCHAKIDPPGYALENFDAAGKWRQHYPLMSGKRVQQGPAINASFVTSSGQPFDNFEQFRQLQAARPEPLARNFAEQLLTYGTGARIAFADRDEVERIVGSVAPSHYGMYAILQAVVTSRIFLTK